MKRLLILLALSTSAMLHAQGVFVLYSGDQHVYETSPGTVTALSTALCLTGSKAPWPIGVWVGISSTCGFPLTNVIEAETFWEFPDWVIGGISFSVSLYDGQMTTFCVVDNDCSDPLVGECEPADGVGACY